MSLAKIAASVRKSLKFTAVEKLRGLNHNNVTLVCTSALSTAALNNQGKRGAFKARSRQHG